MEVQSIVPSFVVDMLVRVVATASIVITLLSSSSLFPKENILESGSVKYAGIPNNGISRTIRSTRLTT